jgi:hypothetical protein
VKLPNWCNVIEGREPKWIGRLLSTLILATDGEPLVYLTGEYLDDESETRARLVVFTERLVVTADILGKSGEDEAGITVAVRSRRSLTSYTVDSDESIYGEGIADRGPGHVSSTLTYADGTLISIPLEETTSATFRDEINALVQSLSSDLSTAI